MARLGYDGGRTYAADPPRAEEAIGPTPRPYPRLDPDAERRVARDAARGDRSARERLILSNLPLVYAIARRYRGLGLSSSDLVQEGAIGLTEAADRFDWRRGTRFGTFAAWWIKQAIMRAVTEHGRTIRLPHHVVADQIVLRRVGAALEARLNRAPTDAELADASGLPLVAVRRAREAPSEPVSLNRLVDSDEAADGAELLELVADGAAADPSAAATDAVRDDVLRAAVATLPERQRTVVSEHFGLDDEAPRTLDAIASDAGVARERVRQVEQAALARLARTLPRDPLPSRSPPGRRRVPPRESGRERRPVAPRQQPAGARRGRRRA